MSPGGQEDFLWKLGLPLRAIDYEVLGDQFILSVVTLCIIKAPWQPSVQVRNPLREVRDCRGGLSCLNETRGTKWI